MWLSIWLLMSRWRQVSYQNMPFFHCIAANAMATMSSWDPQVTQLWLMAAVSFLTGRNWHPKSQSFHWAILELISCDSKAIANLSWAYATISFLHDPLMVAVSQRAVMVITEFTPQNLSNSNVDQDFGIEEGSVRHVDARSQFMCKSSYNKNVLRMICLASRWQLLLGFTLIMISPTGPGGETVAEELEQAQWQSETTSRICRGIWAYATLRVEYDTDCLNAPDDWGKQENGVCFGFAVTQEPRVWPIICQW